MQRRQPGSGEHVLGAGRGVSPVAAVQRGERLGSGDERLKQAQVMAPILTISTNGLSASHLPCGCAAHFSGVRMIAPTTPALAAASSRSAESHLDTTSAIWSWAGPQRRKHAHVLQQPGVGHLSLL